MTISLIAKEWEEAEVEEEEVEVEVDEEVEIFYNKRVMDSGLSGLSGETSLATTNKLPVTADYVLNNRNIRADNQSMHKFLISHVTNQLCIG